MEWPNFFLINVFFALKGSKLFIIILIFVGVLLMYIVFFHVVYTFLQWLYTCIILMLTIEIHVICGLIQLQT